MSRSVVKLTYRIETAGDIAALAETIASDQSTGTFMAVPDETPALKARVAAQVVAIRPLAPVAVPSVPAHSSGQTYARAWAAPAGERDARWCANCSRPMSILSKTMKS